MELRKKLTTITSVFNQKCENKRIKVLQNNDTHNINQSNTISLSQLSVNSSDDNNSVDQ